MGRFAARNPPFNCPHCPNKKCGDQFSLLLHIVLSHESEKSYVMELYKQAYPQPVPVVTLDEVLPALPSVLQKDDQCPFCERIFPSAESIRRHITEKHGEHCKLCNIMIEGDFDQHLFDFHYKEKLNNAIPSHVRGCSGKNS